MKRRACPPEPLAKAGEGAVQACIDHQIPDLCAESRQEGRTDRDPRTDRPPHDGREVLLQVPHRSFGERLRGGDQHPVASVPREERRIERVEDGRDSVEELRAREALRTRAQCSGETVRRKTAEDLRKGFGKEAWRHLGPPSSGASTLAGPHAASVGGVPVDPFRTARSAAAR